MYILRLLRFLQDHVSARYEAGRSGVIHRLTDARSVYVLNHLRYAVALDGTFLHSTLLLSLCDPVWPSLLQSCASCSRCSTRTRTVRSRLLKSRVSSRPWDRSLMTHASRRSSSKSISTVGYSPVLSHSICHYEYLLTGSWLGSQL